jgi:hypothetical protein
MNVCSGTVACFHGQVSGDPCLEATGFDCDGVVSGREKCEAIIARTIGLQGTRLVGFEIS